MRVLRVAFCCTIGLAGLALPTHFARSQWVQTSSLWGPNTIVHALALSANATGGTTLFAGIEGFGVFVSTDEGAHWNGDNTGVVSSSSVHALTIIPRGSGGQYIVAGSTKIYRSANNGASWDMVSGDQWPDALSFALSTGDSGGLRLYAGTRSSQILFSLDSGATWTQITSAPQFPGILSLAVGPRGSGGTPLYAGMNGYIHVDIYVAGGVVRSTNGWTSWKPIGLTYESVRGLAVFPGDNGLNCLVAASIGGVERSTDDGMSWANITSGLPTHNWYYCLAVVDSHLFAGSDSGIFMSTDRGINWIDVNKGLPANTKVYSIVASPASVPESERSLLLGTYRAGVWRRKLFDVLSSVDPVDGVMPVRCALEQNYPNPFNPSTTIPYGLPSRSHVTLTVFNTLGQQVSVLQNGEQDAGYHEVGFDAGGLPSGVYFYRLTAGSVTVTKRLLLVR